MSYSLWNVFLLASQQVYVDCKDAYSKGQQASKVYTINPEYGEPFQAYCNMDIDGGGWTVIARRKNDSVNFNRSWNDYVSGFGDLNGEHYLGLEKVHRLTKTISVLRVDVTSYTQGSKYLKYSGYKVGPAPKYSQYKSNDYIGNTDSLQGQFHNGVKVTTKENGEDDWGPIVFKNCYSRNFNGPYNDCVWFQVDDKHIMSAIEFTEAKIRRP